MRNLNSRALLIATIFLLTWTYASLAQSLPELNFYRMNRLYLNPGYAGTNGDPQASLTIRQQWTGFGDAPTTALLAADKEHGSQKIGYGFTLLNDRQGYNNRLLLNGCLSYQLPLSDGLKLGFGTNVGFDWYTLQYKQLTYWDQDDQVFQQEGRGAFMPRIGFGAYLHATDFYAGLSAPDLVTIDPSGFYKDPATGTTIRPLNVVATGGGNLYLTSAWQFAPTATVKFYQPSGVVVDLSAGLIYMDKFSFGAGYRSNGSVMAYGVMQVSRSIKVAYSFQYMFSNASLASLGNHEAFASWKQLW